LAAWTPSAPIGVIVAMPCGFDSQPGDAGLERLRAGRRAVARVASIVDSHQFQSPRPRLVESAGSSPRSPRA
jgi:hypothetical protein